MRYMTVESVSSIANMVKPVRDSEGIVAFNVDQEVVMGMQGVLLTVADIARGRDCSGILEGGEALYPDEVMLFLRGLSADRQAAKKRNESLVTVGVLDAIQTARYLELLQANPTNHGIYERALRQRYESMTTKAPSPPQQPEEVAPWRFIHRRTVDVEWAQYLRASKYWDNVNKQLSEDEARQALSFHAASYILELHESKAS